MGSEIFKLKSLYMDDTIVRGARISILNARETKTLLTNPGDNPVVKTGETGVNMDYVVQASLAGNNLKGYGTFTHNSPVVSGYTGPQDIKHSDIIRLDTDMTFYTVTGIQGTDIYLTDKYVKPETSTPSVQSGSVTLRKVKLGSAMYEYAGSTGDSPNIYYDRNKSNWGVTGMDMAITGTVSNPVDFSTGMQIQFLPGASVNKPDLLTVGSIYKTVVDNNPTPVSDVSLSPLPYPHESLKVFVGTGGSKMVQKVEGEDYVINYTQDPEYKTPRPPYEEREGAYIKFLDRLVDEVQIDSIGGTFEGRVSISKKSVLPGGMSLVRPVSSIMPNETFKIKVAGIEKRAYAEYLPDYDSGIVTFVKHRNSEHLIDTIIYPKRITWDGISVIRGVGQDQVKNTDDLVIPGYQGLPGITGMVYYEDTDANNLIRDTDYLLDPESGAISFTQPLKDSESVLVSYYVRGEEVLEEPIALDDLRTNKYPIISGSVTITEKYNTQENDLQVTKTKVLIEGQDYSISYITGRITLLNLSGSEDIVSLQATYTPLAQIHCILQTIPGDTVKHRMTIVGDVLKVINPKALTFYVNNPVVSVPVAKVFRENITDSNYDFSGTILPGSLTSVRNESGTESYGITGYQYTDLTRQLVLDPALSNNLPEIEETVVADYSFEAETLPYAPIVVLNTIYNDGDDYFVIEGFDRTDILKKDMTIRIDNFDPENSYYYKIKNVIYSRGNTTVYLYGTFPEIIVNPSFYLFDDEIAWQDLPLGSTVDKSIAVLSEAIAIKGNLLEIKRSIKQGTLLMVNDQQIYSVTSVTFTADEAIIGISPGLQKRITETVRYSSLPVHEAGDTQLTPQYFALLDPTQPAFKLTYKAPNGFEGSAKILIDTEKIVITESIRGIVNPIPYIYTIVDYPNLYTLAKAIQATASTYNVNVPRSGVPDYNPFTIFPTGNLEEDYYLGEGSWSTDLIIPFEQDTPVDLPYVVKIAPELYKWTLLQTYVYRPSFTIKDTDKTSMFRTGNLVAFRNKLDGVIYFHEVERASLETDQNDTSKNNTIVILRDTIRANMLSPTVYKYDAVTWQTVDNAIVNVDRVASTITFDGKPAHNLRESSIIKIADRYIYHVAKYTQGASSFTLKLIPSIDENVRMETYHGYVKQSSLPVYLDEPGPQPYLNITYTIPKGHTGSATVFVDANEITFTEILDNSTSKITTFLFREYGNIIELAAAINEIESYVPSYKPFLATVPEAYIDALMQDNFDDYKLKSTDAARVYLPTNITIAVSSFEVFYTAPVGYEARSDIRVLADEIVLKETVVGYNNGEDAIKEVRIAYRDIRSLRDLAQNVIPAVTSLVVGADNPYTCDLLNTDLFVDEGLWDYTHIVPLSPGEVKAPVKVMAMVDSEYWYRLGPLNERRLVNGTDYEIEAGVVTLATAIAPLDRYRFSYMGAWDLAEYENSSITCTCRYFSTLPAGSRVDVYMDYLNIDQFYLQKLTERKFSEIVVAPQVQELLAQKGGSGGQGSDNGADSNSTPNYEGGISDLYYALRDEEIKKQLYLRFYQWYKQRLRNLTTELQITLGFKFAHSNAVGKDNSGQYTLDNEYVETEDYTLTSDDDLSQINRGFSKFFPVGYEGQAPKYYGRFTDEYQTYNDVYCCNIKKTGVDLKVTTVGYIKSENPYWGGNLDFVVWDEQYINKNLVGKYQVGVPKDDRTFSSGAYSFLKRIEVGDKIRVAQYDAYYEIAEIVAPKDKDYQYLVLKTPFTQGLKNNKKKGIRTFDVSLGSDGTSNLKDDKGNPVDFKDLMDALPVDGFSIFVKRQSVESFPMMDDRGSLGASAIGAKIEGHVTNTRRIKKPNWKLLLSLLFPAAMLLPEKTKNFKIMVKKDSEGDWETLYPDTFPDYKIDLKKLTFKEERNIDDVMDALRFDFTEKYQIPPVPPSVTPISVYDIEEQSNQGYGKYFYLSFERVYDAEEKSGYYEGIVLRAKNREWWFKVVNGGSQDIVEEYGFDPDNVYENFYDPDNIYKNVLKEKQAWETEELIIKDLYDHSDKIARGFDQGNLNNVNSRYQGYLAKQPISKIVKTTFTVIENESGTILDSVSTDTTVPSGIYVTVSSTGTLPTPLRADTVYYSIAAGNHRCRFMNVYYNGQPETYVNITDKGKGKHTLTQVNIDGISDILALRIPAYEKQLLFLISTQGPVYQTLYPDMVHPEDSASHAIATTFRQTSDAWSLYKGFYGREQFFKTLNHDNNITWRNDYVRWVLSLEPGLIYQKDAKQMYDTSMGVLTVGLKEIPALNIRVSGNDKYTVENATVSVLADYTGKYIQITCDIISIANPSVRTDGVNIRFNLYKTESVGGIDTVMSKTLDEICTDINAWYYDNRPLFVCSNVFAYYENCVTSNMLMVSGLPVDPVIGALLHVTTVPDHRGSDPRVLFLNKNVEDRIYTHGVREMPGFTLTYLGDYYTASKSIKAIELDASVNVVSEYSYHVSVDDDSHKVFYASGTFSSLFVAAHFLQAQSTFSVEIPLYDSDTKTYLTLSELITRINDYEIDLILPQDKVKPLSASLLYNVYPYGSLSSATLVSSEDEEQGTYYRNSTTGVLYALPNSIRIPTHVNQGLYRVYYDTDRTKKLEIKFNEVIVDGAVVRTNTTASSVFTFDFQKSDLTFKTIAEICSEISAFKYKQTRLFEAKPSYEEPPESALSTQYVIVDNDEKFLGYDQSTTIYVDTFTVNIDDPISARSVVNAKNAYFSHPMYTSNGNPRKEPINGIPVPGRWDDMTEEQVLELECVNGDTWEYTFNDYESGAEKSFKPFQEIIDKIDNTGVLTQEEFNSIKYVEDKPVVSMTKEIVLTRDKGTNPKSITINLRKNDTITKVVQAINTGKFNADGKEDPEGVVQPYFVARLIGNPTIQGEYKSYELQATYLPIIRTFIVPGDDPELKDNYLVGWELETHKYSAAQKARLGMAAKRYSRGDTYRFTMDPPDIAYTNTLLKNPAGFRKDTLAFDIYSWDIAAHYEVKDNWIYFRSGSLSYSAVTDLGQPDKTLGIGIPIAGSGHALAPDDEPLIDLINRINNHPLVRKWFYANLRFTRTGTSTPGYFEYGYLPNFSADVPLSILDDIMLRDDAVLSLTSGTGYLFTSSAYKVNDTENTIDLSCDWQYSYDYSLEYDFNALTLNTIQELANQINTDVAPQISISIFEANVVGTHGSDISIDLLSDSGLVAEVSETFTVNVSGDYLITLRNDWRVNDIIRVTSTGSLPSPLVAGTDYYVVNIVQSGTNYRLYLSTTFGGPVVDITSSGTGTHTVHRRYVDLNVGTVINKIPALQIKVRNISGSAGGGGTFTISNARYNIPFTRDSLTLTCTITYSKSYALVGLDYSSQTMAQLATTISGLKDYPDVIFPPLFRSTTVHDMYDVLMADRLKDAIGEIGLGVSLYAYLGDLVAMRLLNMKPQANVTVTDSTFRVISNSAYEVSVPADKDLHYWIETTIHGDYTEKMTSLDVLPIKVPGVNFGVPAIMPLTHLHSDNEPAHVYFGVLGDIQWIQISDYNLHIQMNYIKERLGKPWAGTKDYYTPEEFNVNNPYAINIDNFLGYMRTTRYNQIKNSVINEALVQNKYFWLYMKFHKEFGCDQRVKALKKMIAEKEKDSSTIGLLL